jgi:hypothetical protein
MSSQINEIALTVEVPLFEKLNCMVKQIFRVVLGGWGLKLSYSNHVSLF